MSLIFNVPINSVSFGQVSTCLLREAFSRNLQTGGVIPLAGQVDLSSQKPDDSFQRSLSEALSKSLTNHDPNIPSFKVWHLNNDSLSSVSHRQFLLSFHETDSVTQHELNVAKRSEKLIFSSKYTCDVFKSAGLKNVEHMPLAFDSYNFKALKAKAFSDDRITFTLGGKFEHRKHHAKILSAWAKKFGDNKNYYLNCSLFNKFVSPEDNNALIAQALQGKRYFNINFLGFMDDNLSYNDFLNSGDIIIGMSGGEGWGLPEFQSVAMGKHSVILNGHGYKEWATSENSVLVEPKGTVPVYDGMFFKEGAISNQGNILNWQEDDFVSACELAIKRVQANKVNEAGLKLQEDFSEKKSLDRLLEIVQ